MTSRQEITERFQKANKMVRVNGILAVTFGALGTFFWTVFCGILLTNPSPYDGSSGAENPLAILLVSFFVLLLPHLFLLFSGASLLRNPTPGMARGLIITNLVIGVLGNIVIMIVAIIALVQTSDYERGYGHK